MGGPRRPALLRPLVSSYHLHNPPGCSSNESIDTKVWARQGLRGKAALNNTKTINEYDVRQGAGCLYSLYCLEVSVLGSTALGFERWHHAYGGKGGPLVPSG